ncbi:MAG: lysine exporter LysO family protein [Mucinivorans sp.]
MLKIFAVMVASMVLGWLLRRPQFPHKALGRLILVVIMLMMWLIGVEMGSSEQVLGNLSSIFQDALLLTLGALVGTIVLAWTVNKFIVHSKIEHSTTHLGRSNHRFSLLVVALFALGVGIGYLGWGTFLMHGASTWALYLLMALVGLNIGSDVQALRALRGQPWRVVFVPVATVVGTLLGVGAVCPLLGLGLSDSLAVGSGMGYYSLSSVLLSELRGVEIGSIALMVNVTRELTTVVLAPWIARRFSPVALICCGGATTLDVTLPVVVGTCGSGFVGMALFQGVVVDLSVPFLVTFFASI